METLSIDKIAIGLWGCFFGAVATILVGSVVAYAQSLRRIALNASLSALSSGFFAAAFLGVLPIANKGSVAVFLALVILFVAVMLTYLLLAELGFLGSKTLQRQSLIGLGGVLVAVLLVGWFLSATGFFVLSVAVACALGALAFAAAFKAARRGDHLAKAVTFAVGWMLVALYTLSWIAFDRAQASWWLHAISAMAATLFMSTLAWVLCARYFYLIELHKLMAYGPSYDPVTRMRSHLETGQMVGAVFKSFRDKPQPMGIVVLTIANLYTLEQLHGSAAVNHALFVCAARLRRTVPSHLEMGRLGTDGFVLVMPQCKNRLILVGIARAVEAQLRRSVSLSTSRDAARMETESTVWVADIGVGVLIVSKPESRGSDAIAMGRRMSRTAISYASRIAWFDSASGETIELPGS